MALDIKLNPCSFLQKEKVISSLPSLSLLPPHHNILHMTALAANLKALEELVKEGTLTRELADKAKQKYIAEFTEQVNRGQKEDSMSEFYRKAQEEATHPHLRAYHAWENFQTHAREMRKSGYAKFVEQVHEEYLQRLYDRVMPDDVALVLGLLFVEDDPEDAVCNLMYTLVYGQPAQYRAALNWAVYHDMGSTDRTNFGPIVDTCPSCLAAGRNNGRYNNRLRQEFTTYLTGGGTHDERPPTGTGQGLSGPLHAGFGPTQPPPVFPPAISDPFSPHSFGVRVPLEEAAEQKAAKNGRHGTGGKAAN